MSNRKGGLGRGLDSLIPTTITTNLGVRVAIRDEVDINSIVPNPKQPRYVFDLDQLNELAASIKEVGILQPPVVRDIGDGKFELIMGERRLRAAKIAGLLTIPIIVRETSNNDLLREALLENIHRSELNPLEEAAAYQNLLRDFNYTHEELATKIGKSRPAITNTLRLLNLPPAVQKRVAAGVLTAGHARALLTLTNDQDIEKIATRIVAEGLSVRAVEEIVATFQPSNKKAKFRAGKILSPRIKEIGDHLSDQLDTRVQVELGAKKGKIIIEFATLEDLERITKIIS
jgi:ParB family chromosome partitioning protein